MSTGRHEPTAAASRLRAGGAGEAAAAAHLRQAGMRILAADWRCRLGQIDIVAEEAGLLVVVEVKARRSTGFGLPEEAVDARKRRRLCMLAEAYRQRTGRSSQPVRIDVVAILLDGDLGVRRLTHIRGAVDCA